MRNIIIILIVAYLTSCSGQSGVDENRENLTRKLRDDINSANNQEPSCSPPTSDKTIRDMADWNYLQNLTLKDLKWNQARKLEVYNGVTIVQGTWSGGKFDAFLVNEEVQGGYEIKTIELSEVATLYLPPHFRNKKSLPGVVYAKHVESLASKKAKLLQELSEP